MIRIFLLALAMCCLTGKTFGQNYQAEFLEAKRLFNNGDYRVAKDAFRSLVASSAKHDFGEYSSFFYGLSAYKSESYSQARDMWLQILAKYPDWKQNEEVRYWIAATHLRTGEYQKANRYLTEISDKKLKREGEGLKLQYFREIEIIPGLIDLYKNNEEDDLLARYLLSDLVQKDSLYDYEETALEIIDQLKLKEEDYFTNPYEVTFKDEYNIAVLFPFDFDSIQGANNVARNRLIMDTYEGIRYAIEQLNANGKKFNLYPYDTKGNKGANHRTAEILADKELLGMDLIIGPGYRQPFEMVYEFSKKNNINMINPWTSNSEVINDNPFSFLFHPTEKTQAIKLAEKANKIFENKTAFVFYNQGDSLLAATYKDELEGHGFNVPVFDLINDDNVRKKASILMDYKEIRLTSESVIDSLSELRHVTMLEKRYKGSLTPYAQILKILPDSVGHIFVASSSHLAASNFISGIIERPDTIPLIGKKEWFDIKMITYDQMQDIGLMSIAPLFVSPHTDTYFDKRKAFMSYYKTIPSKEHYIGYEMMTLLGRLMIENGKYFQEGLRKNRMVDGVLTRGLKMGNKRNNQILPVIKVVDSEFTDISNQKDIEYEQK
ncbi:MAG: ABC transporter substrate-binding protein [Cyclobacteriaceae bacterium]